jgi:redox-sensing transcriptional repressor
MAKNRERTDSLGVPRAAAHRLSLYLRHLDLLRERGDKMVSSRELGSALGVTAAQIRKDLGYFGQFGFPGIGYKISRLIPQIRHILGSDRVWRVALVGIGKLGGALIQYKGFEKQGFRFAALFDKDPRAVGRSYPQGEVQPMERLKEVIQRERIRLAIIAVPAADAQEVADRLIAAGIEGIFNFAPIGLNVPEEIAYVSIDLAMQLEQLSYLVTLRKLKRSKEPLRAGPAAVQRARRASL